jgi:hypothetical protein
MNPGVGTWQCDTAAAFLLMCMCCLVLQHMLLHFSCNRVAPIRLMQGQHVHALDEEAGVAREVSGGVQLAGVRTELAGSSSRHTQQQMRS